ncbi:MAG TPA: LysM peptidoglycan-binding domain-containing protein [Bacillota bacterium]|nr:LysM peptidoglycan-binding domain-containing protein [Bacillota bacterium]
MSINENPIAHASQTCPGGTIYTIRPGDAFYNLAPRFNTTISALQAANPGVNPANLQIGQQICIPVATTPGSCPGGFMYTVLPGETLYGLATRYGIVVPALIAANPGITPEGLKAGQRICIPAPPRPGTCPGRIYTIQPGDTFINIARRFGYTVDALLAINQGIDPEGLKVGQQICLPPSPGGGPLPCFGGTIYIIRSGDTLYSIARRFGLALQQLLNANPDITNPAAIQVGQPICIPR